jgi:putative salt-induced outer membrane protein YdiY
MQIRQLVLLSALLLVQSFVESWANPPQEPRPTSSSEHTWIELTSGEWLKGTITAVYDSRLYFDSVHFGDIRIRLSKIRRVQGQGSFEIATEGRVTLVGKLEVSGDTVIVNTDDEQFEYDRSQILSVTPSFERERERWTGNVRAGLNVRQGNADIVEGNLAMTLTRRTPTARGVVEYLGQVNETEGERVANSHRLNVSRDRYTGKRFFWRPIALQYYQDRLQNVAHQATIDAGVGFILADSQRVDWDFQLGAGVNYLKNVSVVGDASLSDTSPAGTLGSDLSIEITPSMDYELDIAMSFLNEDSGRYQHHIVTGLSTDLIGDLDFDASIILDRIEKPQRQQDGTLPEKDDLWVIFGLSYDF